MGTEKSPRVFNFLTTVETKRQWSDSFKILKEYSFLSRTLYLVKLSMKYLSEIMIFSDIRNIKILLFIKCTLLKVVHQNERAN